ncbi:hypothetical protein BKA70DRAFT_7629 [Coprinopsis sp. MPI-PUGE-AT-0042]|nr:hypothetical protein BKA70DRAFT_7629 [Coprinopsis sp. MPI-PUGE-AT-0042]
MMVSTFSALASALTSLAVARAASSLLPRAASSSITDQCTNFRLHQDWLVGDCLTGDGTTRITSGTYLNNKLTNDDGVLKWFVDGKFGLSCTDCQIIDGGFNCQCRRAWPNRDQVIDATIDLGKYIGVYSGHILSNFTGPPELEVPSTPSQYELPTDFRYRLGGNATCVIPQGEPDWCHGVAPACVSKPDFLDAPIEHSAPLFRCYNPFIYFDFHFQFSEIKIVGEGAWEMTAYSDEGCTKKIGVISPEEKGVCKSFGEEKVRGIITRPLFNGAPR